MSEWIEYKGYQFRNEQVKKKFFRYSRLCRSFVIIGDVAFVLGVIAAVISAGFTIPRIQDIVYVAPGYGFIFIAGYFLTKYDKIAQSDDVRHWKQEP